MHELREQSKNAYSNQRIKDADQNSKELFTLANGLLYKKAPCYFPNHTPEKKLAGSFELYFKEKIENIHRHFLKKVF